MYDYLIAVASLNNPARLEAFIRSVIENSQNINYAISICDDCSQDELSAKNYELAAKYKCFYTRNQTRSGVPYSWNRACELADSTHIIVANDDILVVPGWIEAYQTFRNNNESLRIGVCSWPAVADPSQRSFATKFDVSCDESHIATPIVACIGYLFAFPRKLYWEVNGFDERYFATWEEIDFGAKLCMNGYKSIGLNGPVVYHEGGASFGDPINQHPAMLRQSLAQGQWIDKWSIILNISKTDKTDQEMIRDISLALVSKIPIYNIGDFKSAHIDVSESNIVARNDIDGWFDFENIYTDVVRGSKNKASFVEVGSWMGKSACFMAETIKKSGKKIAFSCIDIWDDNSTEEAYAPMIALSKDKNTTLNGLFLKNLERYNVKEYVNSIKTNSADGSKLFDDNSLDFIFIDASHDYEFVKLDLEYWWPKLKKGGVFAGHDYFWSPDGVGRAVNEFFSRINRRFSTSGQCWYMEK
mgnify:CR=1 FL=1